VSGVPRRHDFGRQWVQRVLGLQQGPVRCERVEHGEARFGDFLGDFSLILAFWQCTECPAGSWGGTGLGSADDCTSCGVGKYSAATGAFRDGVCTACLAGTYSEKERGVQVFSRFLLEHREKWLFFEKIRDFVENGARVADGMAIFRENPGFCREWRARDGRNGYFSRKSGILSRMARA
jgi:hypothetical protein